MSAFQWALSWGLPIRKLEELAARKIILSGPDNADWQKLLQQMPAVPKVRMDFVYIDNVWGILHTAQSGLCIAYLPHYAAFERLDRGNLVEVLPNLTRDILLTLCVSTQSDVAYDRRLRAFLIELSDVVDTPPNAALFERVGPLWDEVI